MAQGRLAAGLIAMLLAVLGTAAAAAQLENTGQVLGAVTDVQGGVVAGATVTLTSVTKGVTVTQLSNARGEYLFTSVAIGGYNIHVSAPTLGETTEDGVNVDADQNVRIDIRLKPAGTTETVTVNSSAASVDTQSATIGMLIDPDLIHNLPVDGNNVVSLAALLPGVSNVNAPTTFTGDTSGPSYNVNGARSTQNLFLLDGAIWNNLYTNSGLNFPTPEALQEVSILLNNFKAQYGRNVGSVFNALTRSGSNEYHGVIYEYAQNAAFNASDYLLHTNPKLVQNQFGATLGGPVLRDKLFFFLSYQGLRVAQVNATLNTVGFSLADRGLTASGTALPCSSASAFPGLNCFNLTDLQPLSTTTGLPTHATNGLIHNPLWAGNPNSTPSIAISNFNTAWQVAGHTGTSPCVTELQGALTAYPTYLPTPEIPTDCINPVAAALISKYVPLPNTPAVAGSSSLRTYTAAPFPRTEQNGLARLDFTVHGHTLDARYYTTTAADFVARSLTNLATYERDAEQGSTQFGDIGDTWVVRPSLLNVLRVAYKRYDYNYAPLDRTTLSSLGANFATYNSVPVLPAFPSLGSASQAVSSTVNEDIQLTDTLSWTKGNHNLQFGVDALRLQYKNVAESAPSFSFTGAYSFLSQGDELMGLVGSQSFANSLDRSGIQHDYYFFAQDDWRITPRLTLNLGLRYELPLRYYQPHGEDTTFIPGYQSIVFPGAIPDLAFVGDPGIRRALIPNEYTDLAPRFGFAYDLFGNGHTAIRGGFGIFYDATSALTIGVGEPYHYTALYNYPTGGLSEPLLGLSPVVANYNGKNAQFSTPYSIFFPDKNFRGAYTEAVNVGLQQAMGHAGVLSINYILRLGRHQALPLDQNPAIYDCSGSYYQLDPSVYCPSPAAAILPASYTARVRYPGFNYGGGGVVDYNSIGTSNYNALQVLYSQRATRGLSVTSSFSYAKSLDEFSSSTTTASVVPQINNLKSEYGPSDYDARLTVSVGWSFAPVKETWGPRVVRSLLSGWTQSGTYSARTGQPYDVVLASDYAYTDEVPSRQRAQLIPGMNPNLPSNRPRAAKVVEWFNTAAFTTPTGGTFSNQSRNDLSGPAYIVANLSAGRVFALPREGMRLNFRCDAFNAFNTPNLANPNAGLPGSTGNTIYGTIQQTAGTNAAVGGNGRRLQLALKLSY
ncbi:TonB-dependent receptor [Granulicella rosea]|uniref:TonB-dependent receptor n=1 Tax=Granulicella rosea TaxID=474952 RepID=UPI00159559CE|nr:carboxypeptidase-like regulatory domain-containing protein [Granulicella rosea]